MEFTLLIIILLILTSIILILSVSIYLILKKTKLLSKTDVELIQFIIDIYIEYGASLKLYDERKHDIIIQKLKDLKTKYFKND